LYTTVRFPTQLLENEIIFRKKNPNLSVDAPFWSAKITLWDSYIKVPFVFSMLFHILLVILYFQSSSASWLALHLLLIVNISKTTKNVLMAVVTHWEQLALTFILAVFFVFYFTILILEYFPNNWHDEDF
jgi:hypothetical protein